MKYLNIFGNLINIEHKLKLVNYFLKSNKLNQFFLFCKKLASYAERHIDDAEAPLFLRLINLLMNDANYLIR